MRAGWVAVAGKPDHYRLTISADRWAEIWRDSLDWTWWWQVVQVNSTLHSAFSYSLSADAMLEAEDRLGLEAAENA